MKEVLCLLLAMLMTLSLAAAVAEETAQEPAKVRTIITTDGEADDQCSLMRYLLYANEFELEAIVSTSSMFHYTEQGVGMFKGKDSNQEIIDAYAEVYDNLCLHADGYPTPEYLTERNLEGNVTLPGEMATDTEGSLFIKECILDEREDKLLLQAWGGCNTIAAALRSIEEDYKDTDQWEKIYNKICSKVIIINDLDQDNTVSEYFFENWENLPIIMSHMQYVAMGYPDNRASIVPAAELEYYSAEWIQENIAGKGALADYYCGNLERSEGAFLSEGDTLCFFYALDNGLRSFEDPTYGGWAGRFAQVVDNNQSGYSTGGSPWSSAAKVLGFYVADKDDGDLHKPMYRWIPDFQEDFAARMEWCVEPYENANHEPVVEVAEGIDIAAQRGETVTLTAQTSDPDGNAVAVTFWQYGDADTYGNDVELIPGEGDQVSLVVPEDAITGDTIHIIVEAQDDADKPITRYQRAIVTVIDAPAEEATE